MFEDVDATPMEGARKRYVAELQVIVEEVGTERAAAETNLDPDAIDAVTSGDVEVVARMHTAEVASILALTDGRDADADLAAARDELLLAMSSAVTDVEELAADLDMDLDPKEVQAKIEGRYPMTLGEYARLRAALLA
jgi:hypothetical protein